jgi:hypothetical protein
MLTASQIVERLGGLTLAIDQVSAFVQYHQWSTDRLGELLDTYGAQREKVLHHVLEDLWEYGAMHVDERTRDKAVLAFTMWEMSFQSLCRDGREH